MSEKEEIDTSNEDKDSKNPEKTSEGNSLSLDSNKNNSAVSENVPKSAAEEGSGDDLGRIIQELKPEDPETALTEKPKVLTHTKAGTDSGDHTDKAKVSDIDDKHIEDISIDTDAKLSEMNVITDKAESNIGFHDDIDDEDIELRWDDDDDDGNNLATDDDNTVAKIDEFLSEDQLLEEPSNVITKEISEGMSEIPKSSGDKLESEILKDKSEENIQTDNKSLREIDTTKEHESSLNLDNPSVKAADEKSLEEEFLKEPDLNAEAIDSPEMDFDLLQEREDLNTEAINSPEMDFDVLKETDLNAEDVNSPETKYPAEECEDQNDISFPEEEIMEVSESQVITPAEDIVVEKTIVENLEESETDSAIQVVAEAETIPEKKNMVEEVEEILGEKRMVEKLEESQTDKGKQLIAEAQSLLEGESVVEEVEKSKMSSAEHLIADTKSLLGEKIIAEVGEPELSSEMQVIAETKEILGEKSIEKEVEEPKISSEFQSVDEVEEILGEESMIKPIKVTGPIKINLLKKVTADKHTKEIPENIVQDQLLAESQNTAKVETATFKMSSFTDVILSEEKDDVLLEQNLLKEAEEKSSVNIPKKGIESPIKIPEKVVSMNKEDDDFLLEDKLLEDADTAVVIPESDVTMEVDDNKEGELLKEDNRQDDSCTPMDVDITDQSIEEQAKNEDKIVDQSMGDQSDIENKNTAHSIDDQANIEKVNIDEPTDEVQSMEQSDEQANNTEKIIEQTIIVGAKKTVEFVKEAPSENESKSDEKVVDEAESEKENVEQVIGDAKKIEDNKKEQLAVETNISEQITKSAEESVSNTSNVATEDLDTPATDNTTLEAEIKDKIEPETPKEITESVNKHTDLDKTEKFKETVDPITNLDKNDDDEVSPKDSSICFADSPGPIKTDHGLHKPDVMLEIPTQELIDIDDTDFSMNLDQSDVTVNLNDVYEETEHEKTVDETVPHEDIVNEKTIGQTTDIDTVKDQSVDQTHADDTVNEESVDQTAEITETIATEDITVKDKSANQENIVAESTVSEVEKGSEIVENDKKVEETVVEATIEQNMEKMFANDEPDAPKEVPQSVATTSQAQQPTEQPLPPPQMTPDTSDEVPDISDSLGLLAESAGRIMEDDDEPEEDDDADDDDDFDHDESSNQISAEQSEDSNPAALDTELAEQVNQDQVTPDPKDEEFPYMECDSTSQDKMEKMDVEDAFGTVELQAVSVAEIAEEPESAVDALNADTPAIEQAEEIQEPAEAEQMDIETVKLSDTSDNEIDVEPTEVQTVAEPSKESEDAQQKRSPSKSPRNTDLSPKKSPSKTASSPSNQSPSKTKTLAISTQEASSLLSIVDLEESSSEDDIQEVQKQPEPETTADDKAPESASNVTNVNIPTGIEIMCTSGGNTSEITTKEGEVVISGVPKPPPHKPARLNTSEVSIKTVSVETMVIPETKMSDQPQTPTQSTPKLSLEIFSLDSDDEDSAATDPQNITTAAELEKARETSKCINYCCKSEGKVPLIVADASVVAYYDGGRKRRSMVCQPCADVVADRTKNLIQGIKDLTPLLHLEMSKLSHDLVEISDSESEDEDMTTDEPKETIGEKGAKFIEENLAKYLNETWKKYDMDVRLKETQIMLDDEIEKLEQDSKEIDAMLNECQAATDRLRCELYATFECRQQQLPSLIIHDTPDTKFIGLESAPAPESVQTRQNKRRLSSTSELPAKRPAIPLGYAPLDGSDKDKTVFPGPDAKLDDDKDISVVKLSAEAAPAELPPPGEISRPPLRVGMPVYAMKNAFGPWLKGKVLEIQPKNVSAGIPFSLCRVKFDHKTKTNGKVLLARCIAYSEPADVRMTIGTRLIALFKDTNKRESYYSGVVAEIPNPVNNYRYLVFFDDGYAQYVQHQYTRLVCESSPLVWEEVHPFSREFVREYLLAYPERPMVRLHEGQHLKTEWNGKWWSSRVTRVDASLAQVLFVGDGRREWVYRGSTRLAPLYLELRAAERHRPRPMPRSKAQPRYVTLLNHNILAPDKYNLNMPYVEYTRSDEPEPNKQVDLTQTEKEQQKQREIQNEEIRRQRAVAKKSTSAPPQVNPPSQQSVQPAILDSVTSRVVYYTPKNAVRPLKMVPHKCSSKCKRTDVLSLKELKSYNPLAKPLLSGWERQIVRYKGHREVMYRAPCGRRLRNMRELHHYLRTIDSDLPVDLFDFHYSTHCLAEFLLNKCVVMKKDLSHGKENVPVPCVNYYDDSLPEFCSYNTERTPTAGVPLNLEPEFLCGCDCTDDCQDKSKCACWKMTLEGARTIGLDGPNVGYVYRRLPEPLPSGIYECNSRCKCKHTCLNRVAQHPLQLKLQVFKTPNRGWGIRALNDVPKGSFLCVYAGNLLTDATANLDGLNEGDEYLAELDYIEVVEQMKEGYEEDIPEADKKLDKKEGGNNESEEDEPSTSEEEETASKTDKEDDDFRPGYIGLGQGVSEFNKRLRKREKSKKDKGKSATDEKEKEKDTTKDKESKEPNAEEDCITISDDEEVREPSRFMAQTSMGANEYISKYKSVRTLFGKDEACYIMDAKVQGNIGRYLNHSCCPNVFVQNVFVDTHDPRFPWVAFFALSHIKAGTELTWNYNYDVGSVPGKVLYCYCGAANCRGRLL